MNDSWIPKMDHLNLNIGRNGSQVADVLNGGNLVADIIASNDEGSCWHENLVRSIWKDEAANRIVQIPLGGHDTRCWGSEPMGECSFKPLHTPITNVQIGPHLSWKVVWKLKVPSKLQFFMWRILFGKLPVRHRLHKYLIH